MTGSRPVGIHWSGCPAGCGNHLVSDIGLLGKRAKVRRPDGSKEVVDAVDIYLGGWGGFGAQPGTKIYEDVPCDDLPDLLEGLVRYVMRNKGIEVRKGESIPLTLAATPSNSEETPALTDTGMASGWGKSNPSLM